MIELDYSGCSETGRRKNNQDSMLYKKLNKQSWIFAVADGMGGAAGGEICSQLVIKTTETYLDKIFSQVDKPEDLKSILETAFDLSQNAVSIKIKESPELQGMGTTFTIMLLSGNSFVIGHIGDSRLYLFRKNQLMQITKDHTQAQDYMEKYGDQASPIILKQYANVLMKCLDGRKDLPDILPIDGDYWELVPGDQFVICSDGLILDKMGDSRTFIKKISKSNITAEGMADQLVNTALELGSLDNVTVVCMNTVKKLQQSKKNIKPIAAIILSIIALSYLVFVLDVLGLKKDSSENIDISHSETTITNQEDILNESDKTDESIENNSTLRNNGD